MLIYHLDTLIRNKEIKENRKITINTLASELNISRQTLANIKDYHMTKYNPSMEVLEKILKFFNCDSIIELVEYKKTPN